MIIAVVVPLVLRGKDKKKDGSNGSSSGGVTNTDHSGTSGSKITMDDGTTFVYTNDFGGDWVYDPTQPFGEGGKSQSWSKRITEEWDWGTDVARGVNLG